MFCEYFLVREIIHKSSLSVSVDNHKCDPADGSFCPQAVTVSFESYRILLTQLKDVGNVVYVNQKRVYPAYSNYDLLFTGTDMAITLEIPAIKLKVVHFSIYLPYSLFSGNTEGLCGTCDNSQVNECCYPNGSCSDCADTWLVPECDVALCLPPMSCPSGFKLSATNRTCCQSFTCGQPSGTSTTPGQPSGQTLGQPSGPTPGQPSGPSTTGMAQPFSPGSCQKCFCGPQTDPITNLKIIHCKPTVCNTTCSKGFQHLAVPGKCCGQCVQKSCFLILPDNKTQIIEEKAVSHYQSVFQTLMNSCCVRTGKLRSICEVHSKQEVIDVNNCKSLQPVDMTHCSGHCGSTSM
nr:mucin-5B-like [Labrus bergylta]